MQAIMLKKSFIWEISIMLNYLVSSLQKQLIYIHSFPIFQHKDACFCIYNLLHMKNLELNAYYIKKSKILALIIFFPLQ